MSAVGQDEIITVKGWCALTQADPTLKPIEYELEGQTLGPTEVDVQIMNSGLCHTDYHMMRNDWGITSYPFVPGHEGVGKIVRIGE